MQPFIYKKKPQQILFLLFALFTGGKTYAQLGASSLNGPGIAVSADYLPASHYIRPEDSVKTKSTTSQQRYNFGAAFLLFNRVDTATKTARSLTFGLSGTYTRLSNKDYDQQIFPKELLNANAGFLYTQSMRNRWSLMAIAAVSLGTDLEEINGQDLFLQGGVLFIKQHSRRFSYGIGGVFTNSFGTPMILPAILVRWKTESRFAVDINFPEKASVSTALNKYTDLALAVRVDGNTYDVTHGVNGKRLMGYMQINAGLENTWHLGKHLDLVVAAGSSLLNNATFSDKKLSEMFKEKPNYRLGTNYYLSTGLRWNFIPRR
ncbi:hypothetical protein J2T02_004146 [Chitinophaga terrae (ex Kim and Jung 2007)]|uniref:DUF6268 family outer membrane beta-barrel protein n=1 Tax=Chitinophaga terrae (ex Kim and Jung 2007) TaxID=408074 RepID=UPI00278B2D59|nr:DUF6268 family outer membrane beta-barrel protein [Chitinophaga terrae (ex Kim and Jung 2007)]MDQ0109005.1 hypothetical protein [Chitinophaga terrae (ex Kim and Jung 2007)]